MSDPDVRTPDALPGDPVGDELEGAAGEAAAHDPEVAEDYAERVGTDPTTEQIERYGELQGADPLTTGPDAGVEGSGTGVRAPDELPEA